MSRFAFINITNYKIIKLIWQLDK